MFCTNPVIGMGAVDYATSRGVRYSFSDWGLRGGPLAHFDRGDWLQCLHGCMLCLSLAGSDSDRRRALEDDGSLHELVHLVMGFDICTHSTKAQLRTWVAELESSFEHQLRDPTWRFNRQLFMTPQEMTVTEVTNDRVQHWLATSSQIWTTPGTLAHEADQIIRFMAQDDGPMNLADEMACDVIVSECVANFSDQCMWWEIGAVTADQQLTDDDVKRRQDIDRALRYLRSRGLLLQHPERPYLIRPQNAPI